MNVSIRPWQVSDAPFVLSVRNHPDLMRWFRQDEPITLDNQIKFIENDLTYNGQIIEADGIPVGVCNVKTSKEFGIAVLPQFQGLGYAKAAMKMLSDANPYTWSEVFVKNPALGFYLSKCGFKATSVKERAYYKKCDGLVDVVLIEKSHDYMPEVPTKV